MPSPGAGLQCRGKMVIISVLRPPRSGRGVPGRRRDPVTFPGGRRRGRTALSAVLLLCSPIAAKSDSPARCGLSVADDHRFARTALHDCLWRDDLFPDSLADRGSACRRHGIERP